MAGIRTHVEIIVPSESGNPHGVVRGFTRLAEARGWKCLYRLQRPHEVGAPPKVDPDWNPGVVVIGAVAEPQVLAAAPALRDRLVLAFDFHEPLPAGMVQIGTDNAAVGRLAAELFARRGLHHVGIFGIQAHVFAVQRAEGFAAAATALGLRVDRSLDFALPTFPGASELRRRLRALPRPIGLFAPCDLWASELRNHCRAAGIEIPGEVAIVGCDNDDRFCTLAAPEISSVAFDWVALGERLARLAFALARGKPPRTIPLLAPERVVERASTDLVHAADPWVATALRFILAQGHRPIMPVDVCGAVAVNRRTLEIRFRAARGRSLLQEIHQQRIHRARQLLLETALPIAEIALRCGFSTPQALPPLFRRLTGQTPRAYRHRWR